ncbi:MAG: hypothetical protein GX842_04410 [Spirochaetales bacterium]|nr:hypothetical protein [Spirochaetales bacterium]
MYYYLLVSPTEALIASMLDSDAFALYMARGEHNTAKEQLIFVEITGEFGSDFDWDFARKTCVPHPDGRPKNSVYLSVYRALERVPLEFMGDLFLVTKDGKTLRLKKGLYEEPQKWRGYALYKELCPVTPLVASTLLPRAFATYLLDSTRHISVPAIVFADVKLFDLDDPKKGDECLHLFDKESCEHLRSCFAEIRRTPFKKAKTIDRSYGDKFDYSIIDKGLYFGRAKEGIIFYPLPSVATIREEHFEWGVSANIIKR